MSFDEELRKVDGRQLGESLVPFFSLKSLSEVHEEAESIERLRAAYPSFDEALIPVKEHLRLMGFPEDTLDAVLHPIVIGWWALARYAENQQIEDMLQSPSDE